VVEISEDRWLTGILAKPAYRVNIEANGASGDALAARLTGLHGFFYSKIATSAVNLCGTLEEQGFRVVDTNVTLELERPLPVVPTRGIRMAVPDDQDSVEHVASTSFAYSRFHLDRSFERSVADRIKAEWAGNFFHGRRGDYMIVAETNQRVRGFLQLLRDGADAATIDLIGVATDARRRGLASAMIRHAFQACQVKTMRVGTQIANIGSLRLYEKLGFRVVATSYVLHLHRPA
jgi:ribosomal protein S18 acetylase RimI-like enzyme